MAVTWSTTDKDSAWGLSGSDKIATMTGSGAWKTIRANTGVNANSPGGVYFEIVLTNAWANLMVGISDVAAGLGASYNTSQAGLVYNVGGTYQAGAPSGAAAAGSSVTFGSAGDRIGVLIKNRRVYFRKNGTWMNSANPATEAGYILYNVYGTVFPCCVGYANSGGIVTLCANSTDVTGSVPSGAALLDSALSLTTTLVDAAGSPLTSLAVDWAIVNSGPVSGITVVDKVGSGTTDGSGVLSISYSPTSIASGSTCGLLISNASSTADANCRSNYITRTPTIT